MPKFSIEIERVIRERETRTFEAPTLNDAFRMAARGYMGEGEGPFYCWEQSGDVEDLTLHAIGPNDAITESRLSLEEAEKGIE